MMKDIFLSLLIVLWWLYCVGAIVAYFIAMSNQTYNNLSQFFRAWVNAIKYALIWPYVLWAVYQFRKGVSQ